MFDQHRRKFDNFSSLILEWKSLNETLAHFENYNSVEMVAKDDGSGQTRLHGIVNIYKSFYIPTKWLCTTYFPVHESLFILSHLSSSIFVIFRKHKLQKGKDNKNIFYAESLILLHVPGYFAKTNIFL